jgi:hypothetical protein
MYFANDVVFWFFGMFQALFFPKNILIEKLMNFYFYFPLKIRMLILKLVYDNQYENFENRPT